MWLALAPAAIAPYSNTARYAPSLRTLGKQDADGAMRIRGFVPPSAKAEKEPRNVDVAGFGDDMSTAAHTPPVGFGMVMSIPVASLL